MSKRDAAEGGAAKKPRKLVRVMTAEERHEAANTNFQDASKHAPFHSFRKVKMTGVTWATLMAKNRLLANSP